MRSEGHLQKEEHRGLAINRTRARVLLLFAAFQLTLVVTLGALISDGNASAEPSAEGTESGIADQATITRTLYFPIAYVSTSGTLDMVDFLLGDGRLYEVQHSNGSQARHQTQGDVNRFYHTKGEIVGEWEELWADQTHIMRGTDTSPGDGQYYTLRDDGVYGSRWSPRHWRPGEVYERNAHVTFYYKNNCQPVPGASGTQRSWLRFEAYYPTYTFDSGLVLNDVVELAWLLQPDGQPAERYFYARGFGLVGWSSVSSGHSYISVIHDPGDRPDNPREEISCLDQSAISFNLLDLRPLPPPYRAK